MSCPRIVIDTNVLISAALKKSGPAALVLQLVAYRAVELIVSGPVLEEYREVLGRPKFQAIPRGEVTRLLALIASEATRVEPTTRLSISEDESDNRFYECAQASRADYIVTGNARHFRSDLPPTKIVSVRELLNLLQTPA